MKYAATVFALVFTAQVSADEKPNFILIYAYDLGNADTSVQMMVDDPSTTHDFIQTPGLERLAKLGARYSAA